MGDVTQFPGAAFVPVDTDQSEEEAEDLDALVERQRRLLDRWIDLARELKRRAERPAPFDLAVEMDDLIVESMD